MREKLGGKTRAPQSVRASPRPTAVAAYEAHLRGFASASATTGSTRNRVSTDTRKPGVLFLDVAWIADEWKTTTSPFPNDVVRQSSAPLVREKNDFGKGVPRCCSEKSSDACEPRSTARPPSPAATSCSGIQAVPRWGRIRQAGEYHSPSGTFVNGGSRQSRWYASPDSSHRMHDSGLSFFPQITQGASSSSGRSGGAWSSSAAPVKRPVSFSKWYRSACSTVSSFGALRRTQVNFESKNTQR
mmetsp:Transcript_35520/g.110004  ORF Transcript_35520/g.110004 Transcript_35520/m.110004 type:complete len:243 (+) Transcript_35520:11-739(+)